MPASVSSAVSATSVVIPNSNKHASKISRTKVHGSEPPSPKLFADHPDEPMYKQKSAFVNGASAQAQDLPPLQASNASLRDERLEPVMDDDPRSFDLVAVGDGQEKEDSLEKTTQALFSKDHLQVIFADPTFLLRFTTFLGTHRPQSVPILVHYLDSLKSLRAIHYANAICEGLDPVEGLDFTKQAVKATANHALEARATAAFDVLAKEELPAFVTHQYIQIVSASITARVTGALAPNLRDTSEGLAEVFCLTDPSKQDNPIVFASEGRNIHTANIRG